jgi:ParB/RepB/Spo0J family partition protein
MTAAKAAAKKAGGGNAAQAAGVQHLHGVPLTVGDVKKAQKGKAVVMTELPRKAIKIVKNFNPRSFLGDVEFLSDSIKKDGLINPVTVRPEPGKQGSFLLVAGERRLRALDMLNREVVPATIRMDLEGDDAKARAVAVAENSEDGRINLNPIEIGRVAYELREAGWSVGRIAQETTVHSQKLRRCLDLMDAPKDVQAKVESGELAMIAGLELAHADDATRKAIKDQLQPGISASEIKKLVKAAAKAEGTEVPTKKTGAKYTAKHQKGKARDAALVIWKSGKAKQAAIQELGHLIHTASAEEKEYALFHELRGMFAYALWDRGDFESPYAPSLDPSSEEDTKTAKAALKEFEAAVASESAKHEEAEAKKKKAEAKGKPKVKGKGSKKS